MQISIDQLTTIKSTLPLNFFSEISVRKINLYFHIVLKMNDKNIVEFFKPVFKKYIAGFVKATGGSLEAITIVEDRLHILVGLQETESLAAFIGKLKIVSKTFARRRMKAENFSWLNEYEAFTVGRSQIDSVKSYIRRQNKVEKQESYNSSWQVMKISKVF